MHRSLENIHVLKILAGIEKEYGKMPNDSGRIFTTRLAANFGSLKDLYWSLYGGRSNCNKHFNQLIFTLYNNFRLRSRGLKNQDQKRSANPDWLLDQRWVGMSLYPSHFNKNLDGFIRRIDYLEELGINVVHLMPVFETSADENDGGYSVKNYRKVQPSLGTMDDIASIARSFRKKGMLLTLDVVLNHTSREHKWARKARKGNKKFQDYYYIYDDRTIPDQFESHMSEVFPATAPGNFTYEKEIDKWVMTVFHHYQWDLNYSNPRVLNEMVDVMLYLANQGVDILRLDAPAFLWKQIGTNSQNLPQAHNVLHLMKLCSEIVAPGTKFIAEAIVAPNEIIKYFGSDRDPECDLAYNATLMALIWESMATTKVGLMLKSLNKLPEKPLGTSWINYVRSHDDIGLCFDDEDIYQVGFDAGMHRSFLLDYYTGKFQGSQASGALFMHNPQTGDARLSGSLASLAGLEKALAGQDRMQVELAISRIILSHAVTMSFGGLPMLFSGDEIGQLNDYTYLEDESKKHDSRWMHRADMNWESADKRHVPDSVQQQIFTAIQKLIEIRKSTPDWMDLNNRRLVYCENQHVLAFIRTGPLPADSGLKETKTLTIANFDSVKQLINRDLLREQGFDQSENLIDKFTGLPLSFKNGFIQLLPYQFYFISQNS
ncbi:MAG: alpha-amylase [Cyclobacteriaceae bacterium]|nr:MAG: alpha-amylase [Cyclobacteriaceae bacterium]